MLQSQSSHFRFNVIPILADILSDSVKEKVTRIILAVFRVSCVNINTSVPLPVLTFGNFIEPYREGRGWASC